MYRLKGEVKQYAWGKKGGKSEVARLLVQDQMQFIDSEKPYAELWMGTHPDGPAKIRETETTLSRFIASKSATDLLMTDNKQSAIMEDEHLPFIMKVMSIRTTLSLQVHPTKKQAAKLHLIDPEHYPDANHKPELALALSNFQLLCGFRSEHEIAHNLKCFPQLRALFGHENAREFELLSQTRAKEETKNCLKQCFRTMMETPHSIVVQLLFSLKKMLQNGETNNLSTATASLLLKMQNDFPNDVGCFAPLYLNHMLLKPGECCFYEAQELHAYLSGECVECVGCSNNTIRAALTSKHKDVDILCETLNYHMADPEYYIIRPVKFPNCQVVDVFRPDGCPDFILHQIRIESETFNEKSDFSLPVVGCSSILIVIEGEAICHGIMDKHDVIIRGDIFFIAKDTCVRIRPMFFNSSRFLAYRTLSYLPGPSYPSSGRDLMQFVGDLKSDNNKKLFDVTEEMDGFF